MFRTVTLLLVTLLATAVAPSLSGESREEKTGRELAARLEKDVKFVTDPEIVGRVGRIGQALEAVAESVEVPADYGAPDLADFKYEFKVVDDEDINAFSLPGGLIYVNRGLLDFVESDHELAGVLGHEIAHAAHHHMMALLRKQSKMDRYVALIALVGGLSGMDGKDLANVIYGAHFVRVARLTGFTQEAEHDADRAGVMYTYRAGYDPRGLLAFLDRLIRYQEERGEVRNLGIFQTHPHSQERAVHIASQIAELGVEVDVRQAAHLAHAETEPIMVDGNQLWTVEVADKPLCTIADDAGLSSHQRAEQISSTINVLLREGMRPGDLRARKNTLELVGRNQVILRVSFADAAANGLPAERVLARAAQTIRYALWSDWIKWGMTNGECGVGNGGCGIPSSELRIPHSRHSALPVR